MAPSMIYSKKQGASFTAPRQALRNPSQTEAGQAEYGTAGHGVVSGGEILFTAAATGFIALAMSFAARSSNRFSR